MYLANLANFASSRVVPKRAKTSDSRERPIGSQLYIVTNRKPWVNASRWVIRRSRPLQPSLVGRSAETKYGQVWRHELKAAPLRTLGTHARVHSRLERSPC